MNTWFKIWSMMLVCCSVMLQQTVYAQELRCRVNVQYSEVPDADKDLLNNLRKTVEEFMNNTVWTDHRFEEHEKIDMRMNIRVTRQNSNKSFSATLQIQTSRPVYNSTYTTTVFNHVDERFNFQFEENQTLELSENTYISNLSSILSFYAYLVIGLDYDTFSLMGGTPFYQKAQNITTAASSAGELGWRSSESDNRYWLIENIMNSSYAGYRNALYMYHRLGVDIMAEKPIDARNQMLEAITELERIYRIRPSAFLLTVFFQAKKEEITQVFSQGTPEEKQRLVGTVKKLNPANASEYDKLLDK